MAIGITTATGNGNITNTGGENNDKRGFVYGTTTQSAPGNVAPASSGYDTYAEDTGDYGTGAFTKAITGLTAGTTYYGRAYSHNSVGYAYGDEVSFRTMFELVAQVTAYTLTTKNASLLVSRKLNASVTAYTLTAKNAILSRGYTLVASCTAYTLTAKNASLLISRKLTAAVTAYTLTTKNASLLVARQLIAAVTAYVVSWKNITITGTGLPKLTNIVKNSATLSNIAKNTATLTNITKVHRYLLKEDGYYLLLETGGKIISQIGMALGGIAKNNGTLSNTTAKNTTNLTNIKKN